MVTLAALWLPIVLSAVAVFVLSFLVWNVLPWHRSDYSGLAQEEQAREVLKDAAPGQYSIPHTADRGDFDKPEMQEKFKEGPVAFVTVFPRGLPNLPKSLVLWFLFNLAVGVMVAYVAGRTLAPGTEYLQVFRITCTVTWLAYGWAYVQEAIWFGRPWGVAIKYLFDALLYGLVTAGFFGWLWPAV